MARLGGIPITIRLRVEAGMSGVLHEVGTADIEVTLPVHVEKADAGLGARIVIDTDQLPTRLKDALGAFERGIKQ